MHTLDRTLLHSNIDLWYEEIFFSQLILVRFVDLIIRLCFPNMDHDSSYLVAIDLGLFQETKCTDGVYTRALAWVPRRRDGRPDPTPRQSRAVL